MRYNRRLFTTIAGATILAAGTSRLSAEGPETLPKPPAPKKKDGAAAGAKPCCITADRIKALKDYISGVGKEHALVDSSDAGRTADAKAELEKVKKYRKDNPADAKKHAATFDALEDLLKQVTGGKLCKENLATALSEIRAATRMCDAAERAKKCEDKIDGVKASLAHVANAIQALLDCANGGDATKKAIQGRFMDLPRNIRDAIGTVGQPGANDNLTALRVGLRALKRGHAAMVAKLLKGC